jgi:hypothetical protein
MSTGGQAGPVEQGQPAVTHMDVDRALWLLAVVGGVGRVPAAELDPELNEIRAAVTAVQEIVDRARQYVAGPSSGRFAALCQILQEPVPLQRTPVDTETVVQAWLTERNMIAISRDAARRLGIVPP